MPIGRASRSQAGTTAPLSISSNAFIAPRPTPANEPVVVVPDRSAEDGLPSYAESEQQADFPRKMMPPSADHDLEYFDALASGRPAPFQPHSAMLVLHFYRTTQTQIFPVEERLALGQTLKNPFFALRASPSLTSADEYNKLTLTRRAPAAGVWQHAAISEIFPRLKLLAKGTTKISRIYLVGNPDEFELWWDSERETYTVWKNRAPELEIEREGWSSLDDKPGKGFISVEDISGAVDEGNTKLAIFDFEKASPQLICLPTAGSRLDLIVTCLLTVATVHTRRPKLVSQTLNAHGFQIQTDSNTTFIHTQQTARIRV